MQISKIPVDKTGLQHTQQEFAIEHKIYLIRHTENKWLWYCEKLDKTVLLSPPICLACVYSDVTRKWKMSGTYRQINSLFTLNQFGEGLGLLASMFADNHTIEFYCEKPALDISSTCYGKAVAYSSAFDSSSKDSDDDDDEDSQEEKASGQTSGKAIGQVSHDVENPKQSGLQQWRQSVGM